MTEKITNNAKPAEEVRIGVYTCQCGGNISHVVHCERVANIVGKLENVVVSRTDQSLCSDAGQALIEQDIKELGLNRVVIGACAPSLHELTFRNSVTRAALNPYLYQHVGIREQDSWVHSNNVDGATDKAIRLMATGVAKARLLKPLEPIRLGAEKHALVIGGGVSGLRSALDIARQGIGVTLVEKTPFLGGRMAQLESVFPTDEDARALLAELIQEVVSHRNITIFTQAEVTGASGYVGNFNITITQHSRGVRGETIDDLLASCASEIPDEYNYGITNRKIIYRPYDGCYPSSHVIDWEHYDGKPLQVDGNPISFEDHKQKHELTVGAVVLATGFDPYEPHPGEYGYGNIKEVVTLPQLIRILAQVKEGEPLRWNNHAVRDIALIHCVGSRELEGIDAPQPDGQVNNYCSRVCCTASLHTAIELKNRFPRLNLYELYQDIRAYGRGHEEIYRNAQNAFVRFLRFHGDERPAVTTMPPGHSHPVSVKVRDYLTYGEEIEIPADLVVLAVGMMPRQIDDLVNLFKVSRGNDRFLLEVHPKLQPVEMSVRGIVLAGTAQGPMNIQESLLAASAASAKVATLLGQGKVELPPFIASVDESRCEGTGACVKACTEEGAIAMQTFKENGKEIKRPVITPANCTGCGACVSVCPHRAINIQAWTLEQYEAMVDALTMELPVYSEE